MTEIEVPASIALLPKANGYHVPWFVEWIDGVPDFRVMDSNKFALAVKNRLCWICGQRLSAFFAFVVGPMCAINRTSSEPPAHVNCAQYAVKACPFLSNPDFVRRETNLPENIQDPAGCFIKRNPGVVLLWVTKRYKLFEAGDGILIEMGDPFSVFWFREGRFATRAEVINAIDTGLPQLRVMAAADGVGGLTALEKDVQYIKEGLVPRE